MEKAVAAVGGGWIKLEPAIAKDDGVAIERAGAVTGRTFSNDATAAGKLCAAKYST